jgi:hypothetical protein
MRRRSRFVIGSLLIGGTTCLGIAFTSTSATPALSVAPVERSAVAPARTVGQDPSGAVAVMVLGAAVVGANVVVGRVSRRPGHTPGA